MNARNRAAKTRQQRIRNDGREWEPLFGVQLRTHELAGAIQAAKQALVDAEEQGCTNLAKCRRARLEALTHCRALAMQQQPVKPETKA